MRDQSTDVGSDNLEKAHGHGLPVNARGCGRRHSGGRHAARLAFRAAMRCLPGGFRAEYGAAMCADFENAVDEAQSRGRRAAVACVIRAVFDVIMRAPAQRRYEREREARANPQSTFIPIGERMLRILNDVRIAARTLARRPGFSFVVMITLALGIGANIAIFALVDAVLIRPLPYPESDRIVLVDHHAPGLNLPDLGNSPGSILNYSRNARTFSAVAATKKSRHNLTGNGDPVQLQTVGVTPSLFDVLKVQPELGRRFMQEDTAAGAPPVIILTHDGWTKYFGGRRDVVGKTVQIDGATTEVIGVMPAGFAYPDAKIQALMPMRLDYSTGYGNFGIEGIARLAPGATLESARAEVVRLQDRIPEFDKEMGSPEFRKQAQWSSEVTTLRDHVVRDAAKTLWIVLGTVGFLLIVACASVANLFLVRAEGRRREVGVRFALGATRGRVASAFISESMILGLAGGAWGMLIAWLALRALIASAPPQLPRLTEIGIDGRVILFAAIISVVAGFLFGVLPLPHRMQRPLGDLVRGGRGETATRDRQTLRKTLIVAQIALALMLLVGSGLMLRSFAHLRSVDPGVKPDGVLTVGVSYGDHADRSVMTSLYARLVDRVAALPGVTAAGATNALPIDPAGLNGGSFEVRSHPVPDGKLPPVSMFTAITSDYFRAMGTPVVEGRGLTRDDVDHDRPVVVVNQTFARELMNGKAIGEEINFASFGAPWATIVGVVKDVHMFGLREPAKPMAYFPLTTKISGVYLGEVFITIRTNGDPASLAPDVRAAIHSAAPQIPITATRTMNDIIAGSTAEASLTMTVLALAAAVAMLLGAIGLYGVIGYVVSQRTSEIGLRMALGAEPGQVGTMVLRQGLVLAALGIAAGLAGAAALSKLMQGILFEVNSHDPLTFSIVPVVLLGVTVLASWLPARRAASVSPLEALRAE